MLINFEQLRSYSHRLKGEIHALYLAARDRRTPWYAKAIVGCVVAYALSPIDLIPDFIPVLGYLDDLLLLPLGIYLALKLIPAEVLTDARTQAANAATLPKRWSAAWVIVLLWLAAAIAIGFLVIRGLDIDADVLIGA